MAYFTSINIDFFFPLSNLKHSEMGLSFRRTWNWGKNNTCWCSCLVPNHITQPGCPDALCKLWCFLHLDNFSLFFLKKKEKKALPCQGLALLGACRCPTALIPAGRVRLGLRRALAQHSPTSLLVFGTLQINPGMKAGGGGQKAQWLHRNLLKLQ